MKTPKIYYLALVAFSVTILIIGMVHAADLMPASAHPMRGHSPGYPGMNMTNETVQQHILTGLEARGVDVSAAESLLQKGDTAAVSTWLAMYFESHQGERMNATTRSNVSSGETFHGERSGTMSARNWSVTDRIPHIGGMEKNATRCNATAMISGLEQKGVDISAVKKALQNGDITTVTAWLKTYFQAHQNELAPRHGAWGHRNDMNLQGLP